MTVKDVMNELEGQFADVFLYEGIENKDGYPGVFDKSCCKIYKSGIGDQELLVGFYSLMSEEEYNDTLYVGKKNKNFALAYDDHDAKVLCIMLAPKVMIYEYSIDNGSIVMYSHPAMVSFRKEHYVYRFRSGKNSLNKTFANEKELDTVKNNRLYSLENNLPKFRLQIIGKYREQTEELQTRVRERLTMLKKLEGQ